MKAERTDWILVLEAGIMSLQNMSPEERKQILYFQYTNWEGKTAWRRAVPLPIPMLFGPDNWHPEPEWKIVMFDLDKMDRRAFTLKDMKLGTEANYLSWILVNGKETK